MSEILRIIAYETVLVLLAVMMLPKLIYKYFVSKKYHKSILMRLGIGYPSIESNGRPLVWIHAVSVGEVKAVALLAKHIAKRSDNHILVVSTITETGHAEAKKSIAEADYHVYLPFDSSCIVKPIIKRASPDLVIVTETDFWYNFLRASKDSGASIVLINGKISERSFLRYNAIQWFARRLFGLFDVFCIQGDVYLKRFEQLGIDAEKLVVTGNTKLDDAYSSLPNDDLDKWREQLGIPVGHQVLVIGSTHSPEEKLLLPIIKNLLERFPDLHVIIAPRHPERFDSVAMLLECSCEPFICFSKLSKRNGDERLILVDVMGQLRRCYQIADVAVVAGSFTPEVGGHNILEPSLYGVPVICGPYMHSQPDFAELMKRYGAGLQISLDRIYPVLYELLNNDAKRISMGQSGLKLWKNECGATKRTCDVIDKITMPKK